MFRKFFHNLGKKAFGKELENLIAKIEYIGDSKPDVFQIHSYAILTANTWAALFDEEEAEVFIGFHGRQVTLLSEEEKMCIAKSSFALTNAQLGKSAELKFGLWFWRVVFVCATYSELRDRYTHLARLLESQESMYLAHREQSEERLISLGFEASKPSSSPESLADYTKFKEGLGISVECLRELSSWKTLPELMPRV